MAAATAPTINDVLNKWYSRFTFSIAAYILESSPYTTNADKGAIKLVETIAARDNELKSELGSLIMKREGIPQVGTPPEVVAGLNYLSYPRLLIELRSELEIEIGALEKSLPYIAENGEATAWLQSVLKERKEFVATITDALRDDYKVGVAEERAAEEDAAE